MHNHLINLHSVNCNVLQRRTAEFPGLMETDNNVLIYSSEWKKRKKGNGVLPEKIGIIDSQYKATEKIVLNEMIINQKLQIQDEQLPLRQNNTNGLFRPENSRILRAIYTKRKWTIV